MGMIRLDCQSLLITRQRLIEAIKFPKGIASVVEDVSIVRLQRDRLVKAGQRLVEPLEFPKGVALVLKSLAIVRLQRDRLVKAGQRLIEALKSLKGVALVVKRVRIVWFYLERPRNQLLPFNKLMALKRNNSEKMGRVEVIRRKL